MIHSEINFDKNHGLWSEKTFGKSYCKNWINYFDKEISLILMFISSTSFGINPLFSVLTISLIKFH